MDKRITMSTNKENFLALVSHHDTTLIKDVEHRVNNRAMLQQSMHIAMKILVRLDELGWSQKDLAQKMNVSPQQVNKIVRGKQNLTLDTIVKLQQVLDIAILVTHATEKAQTSSYKSSQIVEMLPKEINVVGAYTHSSGKTYTINMTFGQTQHTTIDNIAC